MFFDGFQQLDFVEHYDCSIDLNKKQLLSNSKTILLDKEGYMSLY